MQLLEHMALEEGWLKKRLDQKKNDESPAERMFSQLKRWMDKPFSIDGGDEELLGIFYLAQQLKIPETKVIETLLKRGDGVKGKMTSALSLLPMIYDGYIQDKKDLLNKTIPEFATGDPVYMLYIAIDKREESIVYSEKAKSFISFYQVPMKAKKTTLYQAIRKYNDMYPDRFDLEEADEKLGYYKLSKCPDGVTPKEYSL